MKFPTIISFLLLLSACTSEDVTYDFDLQGHRGARGLLPENTIPSFLMAIDHHVDTIELDLVVTKDRQLLVSHDPWFHHDISTTPEGDDVTEENEKEFNIFEMTYEETQQFDVGRRGNSNFPTQQPLDITKPLLRDAIAAIEDYTAEKGLPPVAYNIETKSVPELYDVMYPQPREFAELLYSELAELDEAYNLFDRVIIQSFDPNTLIEFRKLTHQADIAMLVYDETSMDDFINILGFTPEIWSPNYNLVTEEMVIEARKRNMQIIPWTINTTAEMQRQLDLGVDGIITDYPDSAAVFRSN